MKILHDIKRKAEKMFRHEILLIATWNRVFTLDDKASVSTEDLKAEL